MSRYQLDAYAAIDRASTELRSFVRSSFRFQEPRLDEAVHRTIADFGLIAPPVVEATFPFETPSEGPKTTKELAQAGIIHPELPALLDAARGEAHWPPDRPLYQHQVEALKRYREGKSLVVTSGTGSGKTECFLFPLVDMLLRDDDLDRPGVRVLMVYPLNALVNNQMERLRAVLGDHPKIRFALYTQRLQETTKLSQRCLQRMGMASPPAELISREQLRERPPHILVTNFSMLEYALVRPADAPLFSERFAKPQLLVIDEAHVYAGTLAAELTLLMRRAWLRWGISDPRSVQGIATSATMHRNVDRGPERLRTFAAALLSKDEQDVVAIEGKRVLPEWSTPAVDLRLPPASVVGACDTNFPTLADKIVEGRVELVFDESEQARSKARKLIECLRPGWAPAGGGSLPAARLLWEALEPLKWVRELRAKQNLDVARIDQLADSLFVGEGDILVRRRAMYRVLEILAMARHEAGDIPLLPVRLHVAARGPHGIYTCLAPSCPDAISPGTLGKLHTEPGGRCGCGGAVYELRVCESCGQSFVLGWPGLNDDGFPAIFGTPRRSGQRAGKVNLFAVLDTWDDGEPFQGHKRVSQKACMLDGATGKIRKLWEVGEAEPKGPERQLVGLACPRCEAQRPRFAVIRKIGVGSDAALQVLIDGIYPALPMHRSRASKWLRGDGRRLLLFADNRQVAASLAAKVEESHDTLVARRIIVEALDKCAETGDTPEIEELRRKISEALSSSDFEHAKRLNDEINAMRVAAKGSGVGFDKLVSAVARHARLNELSNHNDTATELELARMVLARELGRRPARLGNLEANGALVLEYGTPIPAPKHPDVARLFAGALWPNLVQTLLDMLRTEGACQISDLGDYEEYLPHYLLGKPIIKQAADAAHFADADDEGIEGRKRKGSSPVQVIPGALDSRRYVYLEKVLAALSAPSIVTPALVLEEVWSALEALAPLGQQQSHSRAPVRRRQNENELEIAFNLMRFRRSNTGPLFRCPRCRTSWAREVACVCPTQNCGGVLQRVPAGAELDERDRLLARACGGADKVELIGLSSQEHTAQILPEDLEETEKLFKNGEVNALVCSTTMELGIDIGGLSATFLTNVPPGPSNYLQRAGRAGRRAEGTSLVITFVRPKPFEQAIFAMPERPFRTAILPPVVKLDSPRICRRHAHAYLLSIFFHRFGATVDTALNPMGSLGSVKSFFHEPLSRVEHLDPLVATNMAQALDIDPKQHTVCDGFDAWLVDVAASDPEIERSVRTLLDGTSLGSMTLDDLGGACREYIVKITDDVRSQVAFLQEQASKEQAKPEAQRDCGLISAIEYQLNELLHEPLLGYLAEQQFLPRYGFPVQVVPLVERWNKDDPKRPANGQPRLRLDRDVALALNEYAPGAEVVAGKLVHVSRGLLRHWTGEDAPGEIAWRVIALCPICGQAQYARTEGEVRQPCPTCRTGEPRQIPVIYPKQGFAVQWGRRPRRWAGGMNTALRPVTEATYATREGQPCSDVSLGLALAYDEEGQILVRSEGSLVEANVSGASASSTPTGMPREGYGYAICYLCGRAEPETALPRRDKNGKKVDPLPAALEKHQRLRGSKSCEAKGHYWRHVALAGALRTETLRLELRGRVVYPPGEAGLSLATTWMVALKLAAAEILQVDSREVGGLLVPRDNGSSYVYDVVLYDDVAGGVGHCRMLLSRWKELVAAARRRLTCDNPACIKACHLCLLSFDTQRYEPMLERRKLAAFLDPGWPLLEQQVERNGVGVIPLFRRSAEIWEGLARSSRACITLVAAAIGAAAMADDGWLRWLLRHADGPGSARLVLGRLPDPNADDERLVALRLRLAMEAGKLEVFAAHSEAIKKVPWFASDAGERAYFVEDANEDECLGPGWVGRNAKVFLAQPNQAHVALEAVDALVKSSTQCRAADLEPDEHPESIVIHDIKARCVGREATFVHWLKNSRGELLNARPLVKLELVDPYLQTEWQMRLLEEVVQLFAGCADINVLTYEPPEREQGTRLGVDRVLTGLEQKTRIATAISKSHWRPETPPANKLDRIHRRYIKGRRLDGTSFIVYLERGLDFIASDRRPDRRTTRASYIVVRDPAE